MKRPRLKLSQVDWSVPNIAKAIAAGCFVGIVVAAINGWASYLPLGISYLVVMISTYLVTTAHRHVDSRKVKSWSVPGLHISTMTSQEPVALGTEFSIQAMKPLVVQVVECNKVDGYYVLVCEEVRNWG